MLYLLIFIIGLLIGKMSRRRYTRITTTGPKGEILFRAYFENETDANNSMIYVNSLRDRYPEWWTITDNSSGEVLFSAYFDTKEDLNRAMAYVDGIHPHWWKIMDERSKEVLCTAYFDTEHDREKAMSYVSSLRSADPR